MLSYASAGFPISEAHMLSSPLARLFDLCPAPPKYQKPPPYDLARLRRYHQVALIRSLHNSDDTSPDGAGVVDADS